MKNYLISEVKTAFLGLAILFGGLAIVMLIREYGDTLLILGLLALQFVIEHFQAICLIVFAVSAWIMFNTIYAAAKIIIADHAAKQEATQPHPQQSLKETNHGRAMWRGVVTSLKSGF